MSETRLQRKRRENAELWASFYPKKLKAHGKRLLANALRQNRNVEKRKRAQFGAKP